MYYTQETLWQSLDGSVRSFSAMDDEHLANIINHIQHYGNYSGRALMHAQREAELRKLTPDFLRGAPYPHRNKRTGVWYVWSFKEGHEVPVSGPSSEKNQNICG